MLVYINKERCWDANKLSEFFIPDNIVTIQNIPLTRTLRGRTGNIGSMATKASF